MILTGPERHFADGDYATEAEGVDRLCAFVEATGMFRAYREVEGVLEFNAPFKERKNVRVDVILTPQKALLSKGWDQGQVGIECKKPGLDLARTVAQARDYQLSRFLLREGGRTGKLWAVVTPLWFFIYPFDPPRGDLESLMASDRIGTVNFKREPLRSDRLHFKVGGYVMLKLYENGDVWVNDQPAPGRKVGCR